MAAQSESKIEELILAMSLEEKVSMCAGSTTWLSTGVERLAIPAFKMSDGPNGVRGEGKGGITSTCFPVGTALACTWNEELIYAVGEAIGEEALLKDAQVLLGPTVNLHRHPLGGRNFECYSEDPYLTGKIGCAYIKGVQSKNVAASVKHFVCNDSEFQRHTISSEVSERVLRELYLLPFEMIVKDAKVWSLMSSYNKVNGVWASENDYLLNQILKDEWGFDGYVVSDWSGHNNTAACANGGLDLEMPGPARTMGAKLLQAVEDGEVEENTLNEKCRRLLRTLVRTKRLHRMQPKQESASDSQVVRELSRTVAVESMVLLKNDGLLPLAKDELKKIVVIGPNAAVANIQGGGSAGVSPPYAVSPLEGIQQKCAGQLEVVYSQGCRNHKMLPYIDTKNLAPVDGDWGQGFLVEYFDNLDLSGDAVEVKRIRRSEFLWFGEFSDKVDALSFSARVSGKLRVDVSGSYQISLASAGLSKLYVDDELVIDNWDKQQSGELYFSQGSTEVVETLELAAGTEYFMHVEFSRKQAGFVAGLRLGLLEPPQVDSIAEAVKLASESDVAILCVGLNSEWDTEGYDRKDMSFPGDQVKLIKAVAKANKNTVVVLNNGSSVEMHEWLDDVKAVLEAWYPGQECGNAIADILFGDANPSGKLTQTFPVKLEDTPAYPNYPGENGKVVYGEGLFMGYRHYDAKAIEPAFAFGYGLSYTSFGYSNLQLSKQEYSVDEEVKLTLDLSNTGDRQGAEVVQLYVRELNPHMARAAQELKGFKKVSLSPGESKKVEFGLSFRDFAYYDDISKSWRVDAGEFEIRVGSSSRDIRLGATFPMVGE